MNDVKEQTKMSREQKKLFCEQMCEKFKAHVLNAIDEGHADESDENGDEDHLGFMERCMFVFIELEAGK